MQLGDIFAGAKSANGVYRAPTKAVKLKVVQDIDGELFVADAEAVLRFVPEDVAEETRVAAEKELREKFAGSSVPDDLLADNRAFHILQAALRDSDDPRRPFAISVAALKGALQLRVAVDLYESYLQWTREEFPEQIDDETFEELVEAASKKSLPDLLSSFELSKIRRAWPSLVAHFGKSKPTPTSGDGARG